MYILAMALVLLGCGSDDKAGDSDVTGPGTSVLEQLVGTWGSGCLNFGPSLGSFRNSETFGSDGTMTSRTDFYSDDDCVTPNGDVTINEQTFTIGEMITTDTGLSAYESDVTVTKTIINGGEQPPAKITIYSIFRVDGDQLFFGTGAFAPEDRPTALNLASPEIRQ